MNKLILVTILLAILVFTVVSYFFIAHFSNPKAALTEPPSSMIPQSQNKPCLPNQLYAEITAQGAAGNIYATLTITNMGKTACQIELGNTVTAVFATKNIVINYKQNAPSQISALAPSQKVYSQIHYPNGPQCQSGITEQPLTILYKTAQTSVTFKPSAHSEKLVVQTCLSLKEKTIVDIWPLSTTPIEPQ